MEGVGVLKGMVRKGDFFYQDRSRRRVPYRPHLRRRSKVSSVSLRGSLFGFVRLCFELSSAPLTFTKLVKPIVTFFRGRGVRIIVYLDDFLILKQSKEGAEKDFMRTVCLLQKCGFLNNWEKSIGIRASQVREFLGVVINSVDLSLSLPEKKVDWVILLCRELLARQFVQSRNIARFLGVLAWAVQVIPFAQGHYRGLQLFYISQARLAGNDFSVQVPLDANSKSRSAQ